jgi:stage V sporulation protein D (sporulation-specific penicillin-binding protein)
MKMNSPRRIRNNRAKWLLGFFLTVMVILIGRLAYVQIFDHARYVALAKNEVEKNEELYSPRGTIYDRNGNQLAIAKAFTVKSRRDKSSLRVDENVIFSGRWLSCP